MKKVNFGTKFNIKLLLIAIFCVLALSAISFGIFLIFKASSSSLDYSMLEGRMVSSEVISSFKLPPAPPWMQDDVIDPTKLILPNWAKFLIMVSIALVILVFAVGIIAFSIYIIVYFIKRRHSKLLVTIDEDGYQELENEDESLNLVRLTLDDTVKEDGQQQ